MRKLLKRGLESLYLDGVARDLVRGVGTVRWQIGWRFGRGFGRTDRMIAQRYLAERVQRKLNIGCGKHLLDGWLNCDYFPTTDSILHLDATRSFPLADGQFDYVFSEHMIEHVHYAAGLAMLRESFRVLRKKGRIRISTPDLKFLIDLYAGPASELQRDYMKWATSEGFDVPPPGCDNTFVINNYVRAWGHLFIYDEKTLRAALESVGFTDIIKCEVNASDDASLRNLENEGRMPPGFLRLESVVLEATKAA